MTHRTDVTVAGPTTDRPPYSYFARTRVAFSDTDAQGIVYYGRYAPYFDLARLEYMRNLDLSMAGFHSGGERAEFVMRHFEIDYHAPATFDDVLDVYVRIAKIGTTSMTYEYEVTSAGTTLATSTQVLVCVNLTERRPVQVPDELRAKVENFEGRE